MQTTVNQQPTKEQLITKFPEFKDWNTCPVIRCNLTELFKKSRADNDLSFQLGEYSIGRMKFYKNRKNKYVFIPIVGEKVSFPDIDAVWDWIKVQWNNTIIPIGYKRWEDLRWYFYRSDDHISPILRGNVEQRKQHLMDKKLEEYELHLSYHEEMKQKQLTLNFA